MFSYFSCMLLFLVQHVCVSCHMYVRYFLELWSFSHLMLTVWVNVCCRAQWVCRPEKKALCKKLPVIIVLTKWGLYWNHCIHLMSRFCLDDLFRTTQPFVTELGIVMCHCVLECGEKVSWLSRSRSQWGLVSSERDHFYSYWVLYSFVTKQT